MIHQVHIVALHEKAERKAARKKAKQAAKVAAAAEAARLQAEKQAAFAAKRKAQEQVTAPKIFQFFISLSRQDCEAINRHTDGVFATCRRNERARSGKQRQRQQGLPQKRRRDGWPSSRRESERD